MNDIDNPKCKESGCGEWKPAKIHNPKFKGKWIAPKIENPSYQGVWKPKKIKNPNYFNDEHPFTMTSIVSSVTCDESRSDIKIIL